MKGATVLGLLGFRLARHQIEQSSHGAKKINVMTAYEHSIRRNVSGGHRRRAFDPFNGARELR